MSGRPDVGTSGFPDVRRPTSSGLVLASGESSAVSGLLFSSFVVWYVASYTELHFLMYTFVGGASCFFIGWLFSLKK